MKKISKINMSYIAGFFDGEGTIHTYQRRQIHARISITQKLPEILFWIQKTLGLGRIYKNKKGIHRLTITDSKSRIKFMQLFIPYCKIKKQQL